MIGAVLLYLLSLVAAVILLLSSRHLATYKRWFDPAFLLGLAMFAWGIGQLFLNHEQLFFQIASLPITFLYYVCLLIMFQAFPLSPNLYFDRWKKGIDPLILLLIYVSSAVTIWNYPELEPFISTITFLYLGIFVAAIGLIVLRTNTNSIAGGRSNWLILGTLLFLMNQIPFFHRFGVVNDLIGAVGILLMLIGYRPQPDEEHVPVMDEYYYYHERVQFLLREENMNRILIGVSILTLVITTDMPAFYRISLAIVAVLFIIRLYLSKRLNQKEMREIFEISRSLEKQFEGQLAEITDKNRELTWVLDLKQRYETLLVESNAQSMREVHYENVHQLIEEITSKWFQTLYNLRYLRLTLGSEEGQPYFELVNGTPGEHEGQTRIVEELEVETATASIRISVEAVSELQTGSQELELHRSFVRLLAIHIRGLLGRCLQNQQSLELRLMEQEMELAAKIQLSLIPRERLKLEQVQTKVVYMPAAYVGGDYVDHVQIDERYCCFLVADIAGHGIPASLLMTGLRNSFRAVLQNCVMPKEILERLNRLMYEDLSRMRSFITMFVAVFDRERQVLWTGRAGHPEPFYLSATRRERLACQNGIGLGLHKDARYNQEEWPIFEDFMLLVYTDGLIHMGELDHLRRSEQWLADASDTWQTAHQQQRDPIEAIEQMIRSRAVRRQQDDDITVLILEMKALQSKQPEGRDGHATGER